MKRVALSIAVMGFFVLALVGWLGGCTMFTCGVRALIGAGVIFLIVRIAFKLLVGVIADTMVKARMSRDEESERPNG